MSQAADATKTTNQNVYMYQLNVWTCCMSLFKIVEVCFASFVVIYVYVVNTALVLWCIAW